jgi:GT2 family glycosyltransferase
MTPVLVPILNGKLLTRRCIRSLLAQDAPCEVYVLDNGASDGSGEMVRAWPDERVHYVASMKPSVAATWNHGLKFLFKEHEAVWVVNNDTEFRPDSLRHLLSDGGNFVTLIGQNDPGCIAPPYCPPDPARKRPHPDFSAYLIRRKCWDCVGPFDERFTGAYCEDTDYHIRMWKAGIVAEALALPFYHVGSGTIKSADPKQARAIEARADRNRALFKQKWGVDVGSKEYYALFKKGGPE